MNGPCPAPVAGLGLSPEVLRRINRKVASIYLPELAVVFDDLLRQGFHPKLLSLRFEGEPLRVYEKLVADALSAD